MYQSEDKTVRECRTRDEKIEVYDYGLLEELKIVEVREKKE